MFSGNEIQNVRDMIQRRSFVDWFGLPRTADPETLFGLGSETRWGVKLLGAEMITAQSQLLDLAGYYRPMVYVRDGAVAMFDAMNPVLTPTWDGLEPELGTPDQASDWIFGEERLHDGELVFASRGISIFVNPANRFVIFVSLYEATTVDEYFKHLRIDRAGRKRMRTTP